MRSSHHLIYFRPNKVDVGTVAPTNFTLFSSFSRVCIALWSGRRDLNLYSFEYQTFWRLIFNNSSKIQCFKFGLSAGWAGPFNFHIISLTLHEASKCDLILLRRDKLHLMMDVFSN